MTGSLLVDKADALLVFAGCTAAGFVIDWLLGRLFRAHGAQGRSTLAAFAAGFRWLPTSLGALVGARIAIDRVALPVDVSSGIDTGTQAIGIVVVTAFGARILGRLVRMVTEREDVPLPRTSILVNLARALVWTLGGLSLLATFGVSIAPLLTALGIGGLAVGLALQPTLENVFSGIQLLASKQIEPGDFIRLDTGDEGTVLDITWRNTTVRKPTNDVVLVPNSVLARATVTNFTTLDPEFVLIVPVTVASAADPDAVLRVARETAQSLVADGFEGAVPDSEAVARFAEFAPPAATVNVSVRCTTYQERFVVRDELIRRLALRFAEEGIEAPPIALPRIPRA